LAFECVIHSPDRPVADDDDIGEADSGEEGADDVEVGVGLRLLAIM
jgi:hypothetical protein